MYAVQVNKLKKSYGSFMALRGINLTLKPAEVYALLGPNGAGKTTLLNILTTLTTADSGSASVAGYDLQKESLQVRKHIGVTFQETVMDKGLSGRTLLDIHARLYQLPSREIKKRIAEIARLVELEAVIDRPVRTYSGGMKRRLELGRSLITNPEILFLDEPTTGLDGESRQKFWEYLHYLKTQKGLTILVTTHYLEEAESRADRVGIIVGGEIKVEGSPADLLGRELVYLSGEGDYISLLETLRNENWQVNSVAEGTCLEIGLNPPEGQRLEVLLRLITECNFKVADFQLKKPTLNDLMSKYTDGRLLEV